MRRRKAWKWRDQIRSVCRSLDLSEMQEIQLGWKERMRKRRRKNAEEEEGVEMA